MAESLESNNDNNLCSGNQFHQKVILQLVAVINKKHTVIRMAIFIENY